MTIATWSTQLADAVTAELAGTAMPETVHSIRPVADDVLEIVFSAAADDALRGIRLDRSVLDAAPGRLFQMSPEELAFNVVHLAIGEPRSIEEFSEPDTVDIRWLPLSDWIADVS